MTAKEGSVFPARSFVSLFMVILLVLAAAPAQAQGRRLVVDRDRAQCPEAEFVSIQEAVAAAQPDDEIRVCPDLYPESVTVDKPLTLRGQVGAVQAENCFTPADPADPARHAIVDGGDHSFSLLADGIVLEGFVVEGATTGIETSDASSGYRIRHNLIQRNLLDGMELQSAGPVQTRVHDNCFRQNARGALVSERGDLVHALVDHNHSFGNEEGIVVGGPGSRHAVRIEHNVFREDRFAVGIQNSTESEIAYNKINPLAPPPGQFSVSIVVGGGNDGLRIAQNELEGGSWGILFTLGLFLEPFPPSVNLEVTGNRIRHMQLDGLSMATNAVHTSLFRDNQLRDNGRDGVGLRSRNTNNRFERNHALANGRDGIRVGPTGSVGNVFDGNHLRDNSEHDAHDDTRPFNVWVNNHCQTDSPPGTICGVS